MRKVYEMPSNNVKVWLGGINEKELFISVCGEETSLSDWETRDLIKTLQELDAECTVGEGGQE